ncbi:unnamed protein product, partial [Linum tenue]
PKTTNKEGKCSLFVKISNPILFPISIRPTAPPHRPTVRSLLMVGDLGCLGLWKRVVCVYEWMNNDMVT